MCQVKFHSCRKLKSVKIVFCWSDWDDIGIFNLNKSKGSEIKKLSLFDQDIKSHKTFCKMQIALASV